MILFSIKELTWWSKYNIDRIIICEDKDFKDQNDYLEYICEELIYDYIKENGDC